MPNYVFGIILAATIAISLTVVAIVTVGGDPPLLSCPPAHILHAGQFSLEMSEQFTAEDNQWVMTTNEFFAECAKETE